MLDYNMMQNNIPVISVRSKRSCYLLSIADLEKADKKQHIGILRINAYDGFHVTMSVVCQIRWKQ